MIIDDFYQAFADADADGLLRCLAPDFVGTVSEGMPSKAGGTHLGAATILADCWIPVFLDYDVAPKPEEIVELADGRTLVLGHYRGTSRATDEGFDAAFAHVVTLRDGLITQLTQITDTASWPRRPA